MSADYFPPVNGQLALPGFAPDRTVNHFRPLWIGERMPAVAATEPVEVQRYWFANVALHPFFDPDKETLAVLMLNTKCRCFAWNLVSVGTLNSADAHPREIFRPVIAAAAYAFVLVHNHPSGDTAPSPADQYLTSKIQKSGDVVQVKIMDHVIVGRSTADNIFSFRLGGLL